MYRKARVSVHSVILRLEIRCCLYRRRYITRYIIPSLKSVYMVAIRDIYLDGVFFMPDLHENVSIPGTISACMENLQNQHNIVPAKRDGVFT